MIAIANTDRNWFELLRDIEPATIINFWTPTPWNLARLSPGDKFYFMLKAPIRKISGFGNYLAYKNMLLSEAWSEYGESNGVRSLAEFKESLGKYADIQPGYDDPEIGCIILSDAVFLDDEEFFSPEDYGYVFPNAIVKLKYFLGVNQIGPILQTLNPAANYSLVHDSGAKYHDIRAKERPGQPQFRSMILSAYGNSCCVTHETCDEILDAAHIQPYVNQSSNHVQNGLCLRTDIHKLFDAGLITIGRDFRVHVSKYLKSNYYQRIDNQPISLPISNSNYPSLQALDYHNEMVFRNT